MYIFVDEFGMFVFMDKENVWCVVVVFVFFEFKC